MAVWCSYIVATLLSLENVALNLINACRRISMVRSHLSPSTASSSLSYSRATPAASAFIVMGVSPELAGTSTCNGSDCDGTDDADSTSLSSSTFA